MPYITSIERIGREEGERALILRQLTRRCGTLSPHLLAQVQALSVEQIEDLGEALLDFSTLADLEAWLSQK